jgi:general secretion pathway protein A
MYTDFFGLKEKPFGLVPNPDYLFLGWSHHAALAQLVYAAGAGEGFTAITGEVGTGKTTLCRAFLEGLDDATVSAYIFNPAEDALSLLKSICAEFGIEPIQGSDSAAYISAINQFLLTQAEAGRDVILVIDEAQNLSRDVLEQLRLLSNLETTRRKLIQIVLVGQPELEKKLASHDLRQLRQRISHSSRIRPLSLHATGKYIAHRLQQAGAHGKSPFSKAAVCRIHRYTRGIPRLINIMCDRCLLAAFTANQRRIDKKTVLTAIRDLDGTSSHVIWYEKPAVYAFAGCIALTAVAAGAAIALIAK